MAFRRPALALTAALSLSLAAAPAASGACRNAGASPENATGRVMVRATLCVLNAKRARHDLGALRLNRRLSTAARRHSRAMVRERFFSHDSQNGATFVDRIRATGYLEGAQGWNLGENIAYGSGRRSTPRSIARAQGEHPERLLP